MSDITPEQRKWVEDAFDRNREGISGSDMFVVAFSGRRDDALQCLQLGMAIMMNKPIVILADEGSVIPKTLERVAVRVTRADFKNPEKMAEIIKQITEEEL